MAEPLYLLQLHLQAEPLFRRGLVERLPTHEVDLGYLVHCQLAALFGQEHPKPFALPDDPRESRKRSFPVLAYTNRDKATLIEHARTFAAPDVYELGDWERFAAKPMPDTWRKGQKLGFSLCACPVVRLSGELGPPKRAWRDDADSYREGAELDAFQCKKMQDPNTTLTREDVYREWLQGQLDRRVGARLVEARLMRFQRDRVVRRTQGEERKASLRERPVAQLEGALEVTEPESFTALLRGGVGRHRSFGFGMLLLRPL